jgi:hypothetical protein
MRTQELQSTHAELITSKSVLARAEKALLRREMEAGRRADHPRPPAPPPAASPTSTPLACLSSTTRSDASIQTVDWIDHGYPVDSSETESASASSGAAAAAAAGQLGGRWARCRSCDSCDSEPVLPPHTPSTSPHHKGSSPRTSQDDGGGEEAEEAVRLTASRAPWAEAVAVNDAGALLGICLDTFKLQVRW